MNGCVNCIISQLTVRMQRDISAKAISTDYGATYGIIIKYIKVDTHFIISVNILNDTPDQQNSNNI